MPTGGWVRVFGCYCLLYLSIFLVFGWIHMETCKSHRDGEN